MMGIEMPETCWAYHKCNKAYSDIQLVFFSTQILVCCYPKYYSRQESSSTRRFFYSKKLALFYDKPMFLINVL